jgi:hypothetical protein
MSFEYAAPPMRTQLFCRLDERVLDILGWGDVVELLDGDISAPNALPSGSVKSHGMFGDMTSFVPREWETHQMILERFKAIGLTPSSTTV